MVKPGPPPDMVKFGLPWGQKWSSFGQVVVKLWSCFGQVVVKLLLTARVASVADAAARGRRVRKVRMAGLVHNGRG